MTILCSEFVVRSFIPAYYLGCTGERMDGSEARGGTFVNLSSSGVVSMAGFFLCKIESAALRIGYPKGAATRNTLYKSAV